MGGLLTLALRAFAWVASGYIANDIIEAASDKENPAPIIDKIKDKTGKYFQVPIWITIGAVTAIGTAVLVLKLTKAQRKKLL